MEITSIDSWEDEEEEEEVQLRYLFIQASKYSNNIVHFILYTLCNFIVWTKAEEAISFWIFSAFILEEMILASYRTWFKTKIREVDW